jgi:hypothetical protein
LQTITCNFTGRDVNSFVADAKKQIQSSVSLPAGSYVEFTGTAAVQAQSRQDLQALEKRTVQISVLESELKQKDAQITALAARLEALELRQNQPIQVAAEKY